MTRSDDESERDEPAMTEVSRSKGAECREESNRIGRLRTWEETEGEHHPGVEESGHTIPVWKRAEADSRCGRKRKRTRSQRQTPNPIPTCPLSQTNPLDS
jgi:hypothetical protein